MNQGGEQQEKKTSRNFARKNRASLDKFPRFPALFFFFVCCSRSLFTKNLFFSRVPYSPKNNFVFFVFGSRSLFTIFLAFLIHQTRFFFVFRL